MKHDQSNLACGTLMDCVRAVKHALALVVRTYRRLDCPVSVWYGVVCEGLAAPQYFDAVAELQALVNLPMTPRSATYMCGVKR